MLGQLLPVVKAVLTNKIVIICTIVVFMYVNFVWFVARYHKKPRPVKAKKIAAAPSPAPNAETAPAEGGDGAAAPSA